MQEYKLPGKVFFSMFKANKICSGEEIHFNFYTYTLYTVFSGSIICPKEESSPENCD